MTSTLSPDFLVATMRLTSHKHGLMVRAQGALLTLALAGPTTAAALPGEITEGSKSLAGCASGSLVAMELLECVGRVKSPHPDAKGRKVNVLQIKEGRRGTVLAWLRVNGMSAPEPQMALALTA